MGRLVASECGSGRGAPTPEGEVSLSSVATHVKSVCAEEEVEVVGGGCVKEEAFSTRSTGSHSDVAGSTSRYA